MLFVGEAVCILGLVRTRGLPGYYGYLNNLGIGARTRPRGTPE